MKKFDFRRKLKGLDMDSLKELKDYHLDAMLGFIGFNDKEADKHFRYLGYIEDKIKKLEQTNESSYVQAQEEAYFDNFCQQNNI